jgi:hypothetical protein
MNYADCINYNSNFFYKAIEFFIEKFNNIHFFVFSNNINSIENFFINSKIKYTIVSNNIDYIDLWIMSLCKHNIISHSTFSWWGAYLNNNKNKYVIYPKDVLKILWGNLYNEYKLENRSNEHYFTDWVALESNTLEKY